MEIYFTKISLTFFVVNVFLGKGEGGKRGERYIIPLLCAAVFTKNN